MRSIWTGAIGFGLVTIPVKLFSAVQGSELDLDMLDKKDHARIHFKRVNEDSGREVAWENIVKGYNYNGKYVVLDDKDFAAASPEKTQRIELFQFCKESEIDSIYYETPYFLEPDKSGSKPYALLRSALEESEMAGVGTFVMRNKEHLVVLKPYKNMLIVQQIRFQEEVRAPEGLKFPGAKTGVTAAETKMALSLIKQMTSPFDIGDYKDTYSAALMKVIETKAKGKKLPEPKLRVVHKQTTDLMEQLKASLGETSKTRKKKAS
jgi:DNA end-binding protein Ku